MSEKFKVILFAVAAAFIGGTTLTSCGEESTGEFRKVEGNTENGGSDAKKVEAKKNDKRGKDAKPAYTGPVTSYTVNEEMHDFGDVDNGSQNPFTFVITNTGDNPLVIEKAKGSCGCTVPDWPKEPIAPGETAVMKINYDEKRVGPYTKSITITSNAKTSPKIVKVKGKVILDETNNSPILKHSGSAPIVK